jgi:uncharacterized membrane protein
MVLADTLRRALSAAFTRSPHQRARRALVKTALYRLVMVVVTVAVALFITGDTGAALSIGVASNAIKTGTYYGYERLWDRVAWGV